MPKDNLDVFIESLHKMLGHDTTARYLGVPVGDKSQCRLCHPELGPIDYDTRDRRDVLTDVVPKAATDASS